MTEPAGPRVRAVEFTALSSTELSRWIELQTANPALDSPYFHPSFTAAVARTQPGVVVVVATAAGGQIESFLPLRVTGRSATAAGFPAADFQGPICAPGVELDTAATMRACRVRTLHFDHLRDGIATDPTWTVQSHSSPFVDISGGEAGYLSRASKTGRDNLAQARRRARKAERDVGPLRFVADSHDPALLDQVIALKRSQYRASGARDYFADQQHQALLQALLDEHSTEFAGMLSALYAGPHLVAAHFGLRRHHVLHWWFPVYAPEFARLAPGWLLLRALIEAGPGLDITRLDLGRGDDEYKRRAMTGHQTVYEVGIYRSAVRRQWELRRVDGLTRLKGSRLGPPLRSALHTARRVSPRALTGPDLRPGSPDRPTSDQDAGNQGATGSPSV